MLMRDAAICRRRRAFTPALRDMPLRFDDKALFAYFAAMPPLSPFSSPSMSHYLATMFRPAPLLPTTVAPLAQHHAVTTHAFYHAPSAAKDELLMHAT